MLMRKGANADEALRGVEDKVKEMNDHILPAGVKIVPFIDRSDLVHFTTHTVLHNLTEGIILVVIILFLFLGTYEPCPTTGRDESICRSIIRSSWSSTWIKRAAVIPPNDCLTSS